MAAKPPQNDTSEPDVIEFGIAALAPRLEEAPIEYPTTSQQLSSALNNPEIPIDGAGNTVELAEALDELPQNEFESEAELLEVLHPVFEEYRRRASQSVFGRLRSLLPF